MPQSFKDPSTKEAKFLKGTHRGHLGARSRQTDNGRMATSDQALADARSYGLPEKIRGTPLGCQCYEATLVSASPVVDGTIEADYNCDYGYHNYVVFEVRQNTNMPENSIKIDKNGNLIEHSGVEIASLEEF